MGIEAVIGPCALVVLQRFHRDASFGCKPGGIDAQ
jgi:hypothetical protein